MEPQALGIAERISSLLLDQGLVGIALLVMGYVIYKQDDRIKTLTDTLIALGKESALVQERLLTSLKSLTDYLRGKGAD